MQRVVLNDVKVVAQRRHRCCVDPETLRPEHLIVAVRIDAVQRVVLNDVKVATQGRHRRRVGPDCLRI